jgi:hypothetical protein
MLQHDPYTPIIESLRYLNCCETEEQFFERLRKTRPIMRDLRKAYKCCPCQVDYSSENTRAAYMLGYYPYYIEIIYTELSKLTRENFPPNWGNDSISACFLGGGPCPEIVGWLAYLSDHFPNIRLANAFVFDKYNESWKVCREITGKMVTPNYWDGIINIIPVPYDILDIDTLGTEEAIEAIRISNFFVMQNCLNDQPGSNTSFLNSDKIIKSLMSIVEIAPTDSLFLLADLQFSRAQKLMKLLEQEIQLRNIAIPLKPVKAYHYCIKSNLASNKILEELFTGEDQLIKKENTNYYSSILYKNSPL